MAVCAVFTDWLVSRRPMGEIHQIIKAQIPDFLDLSGRLGTKAASFLAADTPVDAAAAQPLETFSLFSHQRPSEPTSPAAPAPDHGLATPPPAPLPPASARASKAEQPEPPKKTGYVEEVYVHHRECLEQAANLGKPATPRLCDELVANTPECGVHFMFSKTHPDWACRCCAPLGAEDGPESENWDVYKLQTPRPKTFAAVPTLPAAPDPFAGLPVAEGPRPGWLLKEDGLVVDAREPPGHGGILIIQGVLQDAQSTWGRRSGLRPDWLRAILATNRAHARKYKHAMIIRAQPTQPQLTKWQVRQCGKKSTNACVKDNERENYNWEKHLMLSEYLLHPQNFSHVLMLDADAALVKPDHDTLRQIVAILSKNGKDLFLTDEDWLKNGEGRINGGLMFCKNTPFTRWLFQDTFHAHLMGPAHLKNWKIGVDEMECSSNEQICLNDLWRGSGKSKFAPYAMMASGLIYNRGAEPGIEGLGINHIHDENVEIMHWMGGSKPSATVAICRGKRDLTGEGPTGYGCKTK